MIVMIQLGVKTFYQNGNNHVSSMGGPSPASYKPNYTAKGITTLPFDRVWLRTAIDQLLHYNFLISINMKIPIS